MEPMVRAVSVRVLAVVLTIIARIVTALAVIAPANMYACKYVRVRAHVYEYMCVSTYVFTI